MVKYSHTNIIAFDWRKIAGFYVNVFDCEFIPPERNLKGDWLSKGVGVKDAHINGCHLRLPGSDGHGPTLEIFSYDEMMVQAFKPSNHQGIRHLAFLTDDVQALTKKVMEHGGKMIGDIVQHEIDGVGMITFVYVADPEGNIIEIQRWN